MLTCPNCNASWVCPCRTCNISTSKWSYSKSCDGWRCECGFEAEGGYWLDREVELLMQATGASSLTNAVKILDDRKKAENNAKY